MTEYKDPYVRIAVENARATIDATFSATPTPGQSSNYYATFGSVRGGIERAGRAGATYQPSPNYGAPRGSPRTLGQPAIALPPTDLRSSSEQRAIRPAASASSTLAMLFLVALAGVVVVRFGSDGAPAHRPAAEVDAKDWRSSPAQAPTSLGVSAPTVTAEQQVEMPFQREEMAPAPTSITSLGAEVSDVDFSELAGGGVRVESVSPGGAADQMGVLLGDVVTAANGRPVKDASDLMRYTRSGVGRNYTLTAWRDAGNRRYQLDLKAPQ